MTFAVAACSFTLAIVELAPCRAATMVASSMSFSIDFDHMKCVRAQIDAIERCPFFASRATFTASRIEVHAAVIAPASSANSCNSANCDQKFRSS